MSRVECDAALGEGDVAERRHRPADRTDFSRYFQDELRYLEELGAEHARQDPGRSHFDFATINDPDVLCLLHGFSFLTARIRQNLDNDLPELSHTLCALLYPHYLRSVPALTVVQFSPDPATVQSRLTIPRGTRVQSEPLDDVACVFRTCYDVEVVPIELRRCRFERTGARGAVIRLGFESVGPADLASIDLSSIRLYLRGGGEEARMLYWLLSSEVDSATLVWEDDEGKVVRRTRSAHDAIRRVGFECGNPNDERTSLLPFPTRSFPAYRLLQEYFAFEQKFLFLDLVLTDAPEGKAFSEVTRLRHFEVELNLPETPDGLPPIDEASIGLHCSPSVNLFAHDAEPVVVDHTRSEYLVRPSGGGRRTHEVWSVEKVEAIDPFSAEIPDFHAPRPRSRKDGDRALFYESLLQPSRVGFVDGRDEDVGPSGTDT
ncbi:MAG: type VI secretion system baseplate subunit TssF, partial [Bacteroidota bacterium]